MTHSITLRHNFETAHRLPHLPGKCRSLHGHSWWAEVTVTAPTLTDQDVLAEFGAFKSAMRGWINTHLDHGAMLGAADLLLPVLPAYGCKIFVFGDYGADPDVFGWPGADWPTVEAVAAMLADAASTVWLPETVRAAPVADGARITRVRVTETSTNAAEWRATP